MEEKISVLMSKEHRKLDNMLSEFGKELVKNFDESKIRFSEFVWGIQKHFFLEEKAIFGMIEKISGDEIENIFGLMKKHGEIIEQINNSEEGLENNVKIDISFLRTLLLKHTELEDKNFYPSLDKKLNDELKKEIIIKIKEFTN